MSERAGALTDSLAKTMESAAAPLGFDEAFTLHHRAVFRTARAIVHDAGLAEDVTQEVFLRFYNHREDVPSEELLKAWLLRVTMNVARNFLRGQSRSVAREEEFVKQAALQHGWFAPAPEEEYERQTEIEAARCALEKIKEPMRSCLLLKQQGLSYREIATALQLNETNVGSLIARGRKEFVRVYGKIGGGK